MFRPLALLLGLCFATPALAHDDMEHHGADHNQIKGVRVDLHGNLDHSSVFGGGIRFEFAVVPDGFIGGNVHDELALSFGADALFVPLEYYYEGSPYVTPIAAAQWNFYLGQHWSIFPELGVALHVGTDHNGWSDNHGVPHGWLYAQPDIGFGARYHFNSHVALLMRLSTPGGLQVGVVF